MIDLAPGFDEGKEATDSAFMELYPGRLGQKASHAEVTTGFNGMIIALSNCASVDGYEITPSYSAMKGDAPYNYYSTTVGRVNSNSYHSFFRAEHDLWARLTTTDPAVWKRNGKTSYPGFSAIDCPEDVPFPGVLGLIQQKMVSFMSLGRIVVHRGAPEEYPHKTP